MTAAVASWAAATASVYEKVRDSQPL